MKTYFILNQDLNHVKIGRSDFPKKRLRQLQNATSARLKLLLELNEDCEAELHAKFKDNRYQGEWFLFSDDIRNFVERDDLRKVETGVCKCGGEVDAAYESGLCSYCERIRIWIPDIVAAVVKELGKKKVKHLDDDVKNLSEKIELYLMQLSLRNNGKARFTTSSILTEFPEANAYQVKTALRLLNCYRITVRQGDKVMSGWAWGKEGNVNIESHIS